MDYAFMTAEEADEEMQPTLVIYDDHTRAFWALGVEQKGVTEGIVKYVAGVLDQSGTPFCSTPKAQKALVWSL